MKNLVLSIFFCCFAFSTTAKTSTIDNTKVSENDTSVWKKYYLKKTVFIYQCRLDKELV